jgi:large subunit ribosomal protein L22
MTGPKTNEGGTVAGERIGTRATAKYLRGSATKARQVLDLIRGLDVQRAEDVLRFTDREMGAVIRKVLASAVANAEHNDSQGHDELYVAACFADEGPTLRRFRPRARGRATRIRKRTCHITVVVARMSEEELERKRRREEAQRPTGRRGGRAGVAPTASRRARVAKSRQAAAAKEAVDETVDTGAAEDEVLETDAVDADAADTEAIETGEVDSAEVDDDTAADDTAEDDEADDTAEDDDADDTAPYGPGSRAALEDDGQPEGFAIKGNADSMLYHLPGSRSYNQTKAEVWFATEEDAEAAGFSKPPSQRTADEPDETTDDTEDDS